MNITKATTMTLTATLLTVCLAAPAAANSVAELLIKALLNAQVSADSLQRNAARRGHTRNGAYLTALDRQMMENAATQALNYHADRQPAGWHNPRTGNHGTTTVIATRRNHAGQHCRDYHNAVTIGGVPHESHRSACQDDYGYWHARDR